MLIEKGNDPIGLALKSYLETDDDLSLIHI